MEKRSKFDKLATNLLNPGGFDYPRAVDEASERIAAGEDFNVRGEYGARLSPKTLRKLASQNFREKLPSIRTAFDDLAREYVGDAKNKEAAKALGFASVSALWTHFLDQTDADEKRDPAQLQKDLQGFFKKVLLRKGGFWGDNINTIGGFADTYQRQAMAEGAYVYPRQGTPEYNAAYKLLEKYPEIKKPYTNEQVAEAWRAVSGHNKKYGLAGNKEAGE